MLTFLVTYHDFKGTLRAVALFGSPFGWSSHVFGLACFLTISLDQRPGEEFDGALCGGSDAGRCS